MNALKCLQYMVLGITAGALFAPATFAQDPKPADPAPEEATEEDKTPPSKMTEGQKSRWREPIRGPWPLIEWERFDESVLGPDPAGRGIVTSKDWDILAVFGYRNEVRREAENQKAGDYGFSYLFPFYGAHWSPESAFTGIVPLGAYWRTGENWRMFVAPLLAGGAGNKDGYDLTFLTPLGWAGRRGDTYWRHFAPLFWSGGDKQTDYHGVLPLYWYQQQEDDTLFLTALGGYRHGKDFTYAMATPLAHHWRDRRNARGGDVLFPLIYHWYDKHEQGFLFLPLGGYYRDADRGSAAVFGPFFQSTSADGDETYGGIVPMAWWYQHRSTKTSSLTILPVFHRRTSGNTSQTVGFPIYWDFDMGDRRHTHIFPIAGYDVWRYPDGKPRYERWSSLFPLIQVWNDHAHATKGFSVFPVAGGSWGPDSARSWFAPLYWYQRDGENYTLASSALIFSSGDASGERGFWFPIAGWWSNKGSGKSVVVGPFAHYYSDGEWSNWSFAFPLLYGAHDKKGRWQARFLWEAFAVEGEKDSYFEWRAFWKFAVYRNMGDEVVFEVNPLFRYEHKGDRYKYFDIFLGAVAYEREGQTSNMSGLWGLIP